MLSDWNIISKVIHTLTQVSIFALYCGYRNNVLSLEFLVGFNNVKNFS